MDIPKSIKFEAVSMRKLYAFWFRYARVFAILLFAIAIGGGAFVWFESVYRMTWTDEQKRAYATQEFKETVFRDDVFREALARTAARRAAHVADIDPGRDLMGSSSTAAPPATPPSEGTPAPAVDTPIVRQ